MKFTSKKTYVSKAAQLFIEKCDGGSIGSMSVFGALWADAIDHLSSAPKAMERVGQTGERKQVLDRAYAAWKEAKLPAERRDALTFLAAAAIMTAIDGIKDKTVALHDCEEGTRGSN